jgi:DNA-binding NtrC family response regulator
MGGADNTDRQDDSARYDVRMGAPAAHMRIVHGCPPGSAVEVVDVPPAGLAIGRATGDDDADLALDDRRISRRHIRVESAILGWCLVDTNSRNGGFVDGRAFEPGHRVPLHDGAVIRLGDSLLVLRASAPAAIEGDVAMFPGESPLAAGVRVQLRRLAAATGHVLIHGETGTGKEHAAQFIGRASAPGPFVPQNCAELTGGLARSELFGHVRGAFSGAHATKQGLIDAAGAGVLFLDEIGELPLDVQGEFLRFLEDGSFRPVGSTRLRRSAARIVAATNVDLDDFVRTGRFRRDLLARLRASNPPLELPPLRQRPEDILGWARRFAIEAQGSCPAELLAAGAAECVLLYPWPENLRELRGLVRSLVAGGPQEPLQPDHLPERLRAHRLRLRGDEGERRPGTALPPVEPSREAIEAALAETGGRMRTAAQLLRVDRRKLYRLCERSGIDVDLHRRRAKPGDGADT